MFRMPYGRINGAMQGFGGLLQSPYPQLPPGQVPGFGGQFPQGFPGQPPGQLPPRPMPGTFNPMPFEGGLGGTPKSAPRNGLGAGFGIGHFGVQPFVQGQRAVRPTY